ncbi:MAG: hypothetical protein AAGC60_23800 [Acidobacteriota bacterium]
MIDLFARRCRLVASGLVLWVWISAPAIADTALRAADDVFVAIDRTPWTIDVDELVANDTTAPGARFELLTEPTRGDLETFESEPGMPLALTYDPGPVVYAAWDRLTYRLVDGDGESEPATVWIRRMPRLRPVAGRWPTPSCHPADCPPRIEIGAQAEIGFYDTVAAVFVLCDWTGPALEACREAHLPPPFDRPGWEPLLGDWDDDGWTDFGVYDLTDGTLHLFRLVADDAEGGSLATSLVPLATTSLGVAGDLPLSGSWDGGPPEQLGVYRPSSAQFFLESSTQPPNPPPANLDGAGQPLAGDWWIGGHDELAVWSPEESRLLLFDRMLSPDHLELVLYHSLTGLPLSGDAFAGHLIDPSSHSFLGIYDAEEGLLHLRTLCDGCGALALQVIVDP